MTHRETAVLLVDRSPVTRQGLADVFRDQGYRVFEASDNLTAIRHIQNHQDFNVVLLDLDMPAWELVAKQARQTIPAAHVLSMVGRSSIPAVGKAQSMGAHRHFLKPLDFSYLHQSIQSLSAGQSLRYEYD
jgi:DNA-binding NtrC family response regulator